MQVARHPYVAAPPAAPEEPLAPVHDWEPWGRILTLLQGATGINFTAYKPSTVHRRIARRMALKGLEQPAAYAPYLQSHRDEVEALYHDLLIKVTTFFRNPESFEALTREVLPRLMTGRPAQQPLRIWVPGCATGEEAYSLAVADVTAQQRAHEQVTAALQEKELLLRELHHRVKNNLQLVSSLLSLQAGATQDPAVQRVLEESQTRVQSMALMHEQLSASPTLAQMDMPHYIRRLTTQLVEAYASPCQIQLSLQIEVVSVPMDAAIHCGLILTELITNALQHAFPAGQRGRRRSPGARTPRITCS